MNATINISYSNRETFNVTINNVALIYYYVRFCRIIILIRLLLLSLFFLITKQWDVYITALLLPPSPSGHVQFFFFYKQKRHNRSGNKTSEILVDGWRDTGYYTPAVVAFP